MVRPYTIIDANIWLGAVSSTTGLAPNFELQKIEAIYSKPTTEVVVCPYLEDEFHRNLYNNNLRETTRNNPELVKRLIDLMKNSKQLDIDKSKYEIHQNKYKKDAYIRVMIEELGPQLCTVVTMDNALKDFLHDDYLNNIEIEDLLI